MLFTSNFFLYVFFPLFLLSIFVCMKVQGGRNATGNIILLLFSVFFYICTGGWSIVILFSVVVINYFFAMLIENNNSNVGKKVGFLSTIVLDIGILIYYKYANFFIENVNTIINRFGKNTVVDVLEITLPIGISFYIFQALSYVIDVYKKEISAERNFIDFMLYVTLFPQLIAGPIVRYKSIEKNLGESNINLDSVYEGIYRFVVGLGKKVLVADCLGEVVDNIWLLPLSELTTPLAWAAAFLYSIQIYYDFSGYSDMAIGLGKIMGFVFPENFNVPYTAENITDFWKRWHISLSSFLRDYIYIPMGGNRKGTGRTYFNLLVVFIICGLWHGASWNFVIWGMYHGAFLVFERIIRNKYNYRMKTILGRVITFIIVTLGWVIFRAGSIKSAIDFYKVMLCGTTHTEWLYYRFEYYVYFKIICVFVFAFVFAFFELKRVRLVLGKQIIKGIAMIVILVLSMAYISDASFSPFIYFQF